MKKNLRPFAYAAAGEVALIIIEGTIGSSWSVLPIGGSHLAQLGVLLGLALIVTEIWPHQK